MKMKKKFIPKVKENEDFLILDGCSSHFAGLLFDLCIENNIRFFLFLNLNKKYDLQHEKDEQIEISIHSVYRKLSKF